MHIAENISQVVRKEPFMNSRLRVLLMIDESSVGGGQQHVLWLAERLNRARFEVAVACGEGGYLVDELRKCGVPTYIVRMSNRPSIRSLIECLNLYRKWKPDIVHMHGGTAGFIGRFTSLFAPRMYLVYTYHGIHYLHNLGSLRNQLFRMVDRALKHRTDRLICVSQSDRELGIRYGVVDPEITVLIRYGIDVEKFAKARQSSAPGGGGSRIVGTIGRLHVQKGQTYLLDAAATVIKQARDVDFHFVGEGELRQSLEAQIRSLGIQEHVKLCGARTDVAELLATMDIFVLPSLWEGLPIVLLEAMAAGKPIVVTAVDGVKEVITGEEALLVPARDPESLSNAILRILNDSALARQLGERAYRKVKSEYNIETMVKKIGELYEDLQEN